MTPFLGRFVLAFLLLASAADDEPRIRDLGITLDGQRALVSFQLAGAFDPRFVERVQSGLPSAFVYRFQLVKDRRWWFDKAQDTKTLQVVAMYDALRREYLVNYKIDGKLVRSRMVRDLEALEEAMARFEAEPIFQLQAAPAEARLRIRMRAELGSRTLFSLIPSRVTTPWVESRRFRLPRSSPSGPSP